MKTAFISSTDNLTYRVIIKEDDKVVSDDSLPREKVVKHLEGISSRFIVDLRDYEPDGTPKKR